MHWIGSRSEVEVLADLERSIERARRSRFYSGRVKDEPLTDLASFGRIPPTSKEDLRDQYPDGLLAVGYEDLYEYHESFGTTGDPVPGPITARDAAAYVDQIRHCRIDFDRPDVVMVRFPYAISLPAHVVHASVQRVGGCVVPVSSRTTVSPYPRVVRLLAQHPVTVLCGLPFEMLLVGETARQLGVDLRAACPSLRGLLVAGELLSDEKRDLIEEVWGVPVHSLYGATELGNLAQTCTQRALHLCTRHYYFELEDGAGRPVADFGQVGRLLATTLTKEAMPVLRYDTGDLVRLHPGADCGCGRQDPRLEVLGRAQDAIVYGDRFVLAGDLDRAAARFSRLLGGRFWYVLLEDSRVRLRVDGARPRGERMDRARSLLDDVEATLGVPVETECVPPGGLINRSVLFDVRHVGKPRYVSDLRGECPEDGRLPPVFRLAEVM